MNPKLVLVVGAPGSGKTTIARRLSKELKLLSLDKDLIDEAFSPQVRDDHYMEHVEPKSYQALFNICKENLSLGHSVLIDAPYGKNLISDPESVQSLKELASSAKAELRVVNCVVSEEELFNRIRERGFSRDEHKLTSEGWSKFLEEERLKEELPVQHFKLDTSQPLSECLDSAIAYVTN